MMPCTKMMLLHQLAPALRKDSERKRNKLGFCAACGLVDDTAGVAVVTRRAVARGVVRASGFGFKHIESGCGAGSDSFAYKWLQNASSLRKTRFKF